MGLSHKILSANVNGWETMKNGRRKPQRNHVSSTTSTSSLVRALDANSEGTGFEPRVDHLFGQLAGDTTPATATRVARWQQQYKAAYLPATVAKGNGKGRGGKGAGNW